MKSKKESNDGFSQSHFTTGLATSSCPYERNIWSLTTG
jgi:hypothetical protein